MDSKLSSVYYDPTQPGSYGGARALRRRVGVDPGLWLRGQDAYTLHKTARKRFPRRKTIVAGIDEQWQADLIDLSRLKSQNKGHTFVLTVIDVFSKQARALPLKNKSAASVTGALARIFEEAPRGPPRVLQTDKGKEFTNKEVQSVLKKNGVRFFVTENDDIKAAVVERFNRTLKERLWRYFTAYGTYTYLEVLPELVRSYNGSYHRSIGMAPNQVSLDNQEDVWQRLYGQPDTSSTSLLPAGVRVRISKTRRPFKKGYLPSWSTETFTVDRRLATTPATYTLRDEAGELLRGSFYFQELQRIADPPADKLYRIENVVRRSGKKVLVKWEGYPDSFNSWIQLKDIHGIGGRLGSSERRASSIRRRSSGSRRQEGRRTRRKENDRGGTVARHGKARA